MDREAQLREMLARAHRRFYEETAPIFEELGQIEAAKPPRPLVVPYLQTPEIPAGLQARLAEVTRDLFDKKFYEALATGTGASHGGEFVPTGQLCESRDQ